LKCQVFFKDSTDFSAAVLTLPKRVCGVAAWRLICFKTPGGRNMLSGFVCDLLNSFIWQRGTKQERGDGAAW